MSGKLSEYDPELLPVEQTLSGAQDSNLQVFWLGLQPYELIWQLMKQRVYWLLENPQAGDQLWLLHHHPVYTLGARGLRTGLVGQLSAPVVHTDRGGDVTFHGPGQLIGYPILNLHRLGHSGVSFVHALEQLIVQLLNQWGLSQAMADKDRPGVYLERKKLASIGLRCKRRNESQVSYHGFALNLAMDLTPFQQINPCGYSGQEMASVDQFDNNFIRPKPDGSHLGQETSVRLAAKAFADNFTQWYAQIQP